MTKETNQIACPNCGHLKSFVFSIEVSKSNKLKKINLVCSNCWLQFYLDAQTSLPKIQQPKSENGGGSYLG